MRRTHKTWERNRVRRIAKLKKKTNKSNRFRKHIKGCLILWNKLKMSQRIGFVVIAVAVIAGIIAFDIAFSPSPSPVSIFSVPIGDEAALNRIVLRIRQEGVKSYVTSNGLVQVEDEVTARRMRVILLREDLIPPNIDPREIFDNERWNITDFEQNVNLRRATRMITDHIKAIDGVDNANVTIMFPEQNLVTASVIIVPKHGSDITINRKKIEVIQKFLKFAIEGLQDENIVITDQRGLVLNDFTGMAGEFDQLMLVERKAMLIQRLEAEYRIRLLHMLQQIFSRDRVRDLHVKFDMDIFNLTQEERNPNISRITVSVNIDGTWKWKYDEKGNPVVLPDGSIEREYTPISQKQLRQALELVQNAVGYNSARGDSVTVLNIPFDRTAEHKAEDAAYLRKKQMQMTVIIILSGLALLLISFIIFRRIAGHAGGWRLG